MQSRSMHAAKEHTPLSMHVTTKKQRTRNKLGERSTQRPCRHKKETPHPHRKENASIQHPTVTCHGREAEDRNACKRQTTREKMLTYCIKYLLNLFPSGCLVHNPFPSRCLEGVVNACTPARTGIVHILPHNQWPYPLDHWFFIIVFSFHLHKFL